MDKIIAGLLKEFAETQQITGLNESKQFEMFAAYSTISQEYDDSFEINDVITGDGCDCGIDSIAILCNGAMVNSIDEVEALLRENHRIIDCNIVFTQAKTSSNFDAGAIGTFGDGAIDFFSENPSMVQNEGIRYKKKLVDYILLLGSKLDCLPKCTMYYVTTGRWMDDQNCNARIGRIKRDLEKCGYLSQLEFIPVDADRLRKYYKRTIETVETTVIFDKKVVLPEIQNVTQAFIGYLSYEEFMKLISDPDSGEIRRSVFYDNVRDFQGNENSVNAQMQKTVKNYPDDFILFNNGITIICSQIKTVAAKATLTDYQIVNGCQTSHVIFNARSGVNGKSLYIPVKIIETQDETTINNIIKATNSQTLVTDEQLMSLNEFHKKLEAYYAAFDEDKRLYYERRSHQYDGASDHSRIERVRIVTVKDQIKAVSAMFFDKPHMAARYYGRLKKKDMDELFEKDDRLKPYYTSAFIVYKMEYFFRNNMLPQEYRKYRYHLLMLLKYDIAEKNRDEFLTIPKLSSKKIDKFCDLLLYYAYDNEKLKNEINILIQCINTNVSDINDVENTKSAVVVDKLRNFFTATK